MGSHGVVFRGCWLNPAPRQAPILAAQFILGSAPVRARLASALATGDFAGASAIYFLQANLSESEFERARSWSQFQGISISRLSCDTDMVGMSYSSVMLAIRFPAPSLPPLSSLVPLSSS